MIKISISDIYRSHQFVLGALEPSRDMMHLKHHFGDALDFGGMANGGPRISWLEADGADLQIIDDLLSGIPMPRHPRIEPMRWHGDLAGTILGAWMHVALGSKATQEPQARNKRLT